MEEVLHHSIQYYIPDALVIGIQVAQDFLIPPCTISHDRSGIVPYTLRAYPKLETLNVSGLHANGIPFRIGGFKLALNPFYCKESKPCDLGFRVSGV